MCSNKSARRGRGRGRSTALVERCFYWVRIGENNKLVFAEASLLARRVSSCVTQNRCDTEKCKPQKAVCNIAQRGMFQYQSVPFYRRHINSFSRCNRLWKQKTCFSLRARFCGDGDSNQLVLLQTASLNSNRTCRWGNRQIADMHWEPTFPLVLEFPLLMVGGATWLAALVVLLVLLCSSLGPDGPPGSSCYCAGPRQKPCVSSSAEHQRKPPWSCGGSGISRGMKGGTVLIWRLF